MSDPTPDRPPPNPAVPGWTFASAAWERMAIPMLAADDGQDERLDTQLAAVGFSHDTTLGDDAGSLACELWSHRDDGRHLAILLTPGRSHLVLLPTLPDMLGFLRDFAPMIESIGRLDRQADHADARDRQRRASRGERNGRAVLAARGLALVTGQLAATAAAEIRN